QVAQCVFLDRGALGTQLGPVVAELADGMAAFAADGLGGLAQVVAQLGVLDSRVGGLGEGRHAQERRAQRFASSLVGETAASLASVRARISAMWATRMPER